MISRLFSRVNKFSYVCLKQNVLVLHKKDDRECCNFSVVIIKMLKECDMNVYVEDHHEADVIEYNPVVFQKDHGQPIDLIITIGGDGTVLHGMRLFQQKLIPPVLTFGKGTLGFMCVYGVTNNYSERLMEVLKGNYTTETKNRLHGIVLSSDSKPVFKYNALNEFVISKNNFVLTLDIFINDIFVTQAKGDGLIVSTPTGSTAYSLSVGGPIVHNAVPCIIISPICPLSLSFRPIVVPESMQIRIQMSPNSKSNGSIVVDGQKFTSFKQDETLIIRKSNNEVKFIHPSSEPHFDNWAMKLKRLLNWNSKFDANNE